MLQFIRFFCVGALNTLIDLGVLNILLAVFGIGTAGLAYIACKTVSFSAAVVNSYLWNKHWVFKGKAPNRNGYEKGAFLLVSVFGLLVNVVVSYAVFAVGARILPHVSGALIANVAALIGTAAVLASNFVGYKYIVFRAGNKEHIHLKDNENQTIHFDRDPGLQRSRPNRADA